MIYKVWFYNEDFSIDYFRVFADNGQQAINAILNLDYYAISAIQE